MLKRIVSKNENSNVSMCKGGLAWRGLVDNNNFNCFRFPISPLLPEERHHLGLP